MKDLFFISFRVLVVAIFALSIFLPRKISQDIMVVFMAAWLLFITCALIRHLIRKRKTKKRKVKVQKTGKKKDTFAFFHLKDEEPAKKDKLESDTALMLQQLSLRISEKLKSAYPDAVWKWCKNPGVHEILNGRTFRIKVDQMGDFTHADITFDRFGRIHVEPMKIGTFSEPLEDDEKDTTPDAPTTPKVVDVAAWYDLIGQDILDKYITELNASGHSKLTIKENGDIVIKRQKKDVLVTTLTEFPGKNYWNDLIKILTENELKGKICGDTIEVSWMI